MRPRSMVTLAPETGPGVTQSITVALVRTRRMVGSEAGALLHQLPVGVLVEDLVAAKLVDVAALIVEPLPVGAGAGDRPDRDRPIAGHEVVDVVPAHVADDLEAVRQHLADGGLAGDPAAAGLGAAGHEEGGVVREERRDPAHVAAVEGRVDLEQQVDARSHGQAPGVSPLCRPTNSSTSATHLSVAGLACWAKP